MRLFLFFLFLIYCSVIHSQNEDTTYSIMPIEITALKNKKSNTAFSVSKIDSSLISKTPAFSINEHLNNVAGIFSMSAFNFSQDSRISSRGFGSRAAFGIRGIKIIVDDIPSSTPDGQAQLDDIDFSMLNNIELVRGPSAGLYGNSSGGVLSLNSTVINNEKSFNVKTVIGSYGRKQFLAGINIGNEKAGFSFNFNRSVLDGYRYWSEYENNILTLRGRINVGGKGKITANFSYLSNPVANDPGAVNEEELTLGRKLPRDRNEFYRTREIVKQLKSSLLYDYKITEGFSLKAKTYLIKRNFENFLPFENAGAVTIDRLFTGASVDISKEIKWKNNSLNLLIGSEYENQNDDRKQYTNIRGVRLTNTFDQTEIFNDFAMYFLSSLKIKEKWNVDLNLRYDNITTEAKDKYFVDGNQSASTSQSVVNPAFAVNYRIKNNISIGSVFSTGFENPTLNELSNNPNGVGGFNADLKPMKSENYELNVKLNASKLYVQLAMFRINTTNEIIAFELPNQNGRSYYRNAGSTSRTGIEVELKYDVSKYLKVRTNHTISKFVYDDYLSFNGNDMPGLPQLNSNLNIEYRLKDKVTIFFDNNYISSVMLNDANTFSVPSWVVSNFRANYNLKFYNQAFDIFGGINNLFDQQYFSNLRINAAGNRFYEAAPERNYFFGLSFKFTQRKNKSN